MEFMLSGIGILSADEMKIHGHSGETVTIVCSYSWASTNIKYFCRDPCKDSKDILVKSDQSPTGRYTLKDSGEGTFTVNITDLQESDSGIYWCGVERSVKDTYQKVNLTVSNGKDGRHSLQHLSFFTSVNVFYYLYTTHRSKRKHNYIHTTVQRHTNIHGFTHNYTSSTFRIAICHSNMCTYINQSLSNINNLKPV
uniref:Ig-like domain-containing protein n=1 Tax=Cyprinus carpio carpio TaxID=630221 RepID=A0A8C0XYS8_CYPCA